MESTSNMNGSLDHAADKVRGNVKEIKNQANQAGSNMKDQANQAARTVGDAVSDLGRQASSTARAVANNLASSGEDVMEKGREALEKGKEAISTYAEEGKKSLDTIEQYVREQPMRSLLISAGVGILLGRFFKH